MKTHKQKPLLNGFMSMSDLMFSLSAGLLILGIFGMVNSGADNSQEELLRQIEAVEQGADQIRSATQALRQLHEVIEEESVSADAAADVSNSARRSNQQTPSKTVSI